MHDKISNTTQILPAGLNGKALIKKNFTYKADPDKPNQ